jgi:flavin reductase (DIM6/NTAB) family NADH-FMN oxidoreductase RutF
MPELAAAAAEPTAIAADLYRDVFGSVPAPVAVVTTARTGRPHGATVSAFSSLSLDPPLVWVSLDRRSRLLREIRRTRRLCINVLAAGQEDLALRFARRGADKFAGLAWFERHGLPVLPGCRSWVTAAVQRVVVAGDHMTISALVFDAQVNEGAPLLYHARRFDELAGVRRAGARRAPRVGTRAVELAVRELGAGRPVLLSDAVRARADLVAAADRVDAGAVELMRELGEGLWVAMTEARAREVGVDGTRVARNGGLLERLAPAEAAVDAARLCGAAPVALVCEPRDASRAAREHSIAVVDVEELAQARRELEWSRW